MVAAPLAAAVGLCLVSVVLMIPSRNGMIIQALGVVMWFALATAPPGLQPANPRQLSL